MTLNNSINAPYEKMIPFTPTIEGGTDAGVGTYTTQVGYYCRIGIIVYIHAQIVWTAHTGTGDMYMSNLPFTSINTANFDPELTIDIENIMLPANVVTVYGHIQSNTKNVLITSTQNNGSNQPIQLPNAGTIHSSGIYIKD